MKFGGSTRLLIIQGPEEDAEEESELSVTELKALSAQKARKRQAEKLKSEQEKDQSSEPSDITWGMAEDAVDDSDNDVPDNPDLSKNPFAVIEAENESLYLNDPKKTLRGWFEREGYDLEYNCQEVGNAKFKCTVELPIEADNEAGSKTLVAEATVNGKKKEAVVACALEACRMLDRHRLLRSSTHESRSNRLATKWQDEDFYARLELSNLTFEVIIREHGRGSFGN